ncbi:hypothetical protein BLNAU_20612 [Blattamonas nauphoetae]|uniref:Uncharacterized protein n=1 Tax=Blattamonas nauphoetae TaxID=2049346 RepID=A0ABQ9WY75_9EUKA|nr:hypothetical protein BLNAU_20612 [Blattamonas nauphoetae]
MCHVYHGKRMRFTADATKKRRGQNTNGHVSYGYENIFSAGHVPLFRNSRLFPQNTHIIVFSHCISNGHSSHIS